MARARNPENAIPPVTVLPASPEIHPDRSAVGDDLARRLPGLGLGALRLLLQTLRERLGTAAERSGDIESARLLSHEINNRLTVTNLAHDLRRLDDHRRFSGTA